AGDVLAADPARAERHDLHPEPPSEVVVASAQMDERAELVRRWMRIGRDARAVHRLESGAADDRDVLAELRRQPDALLLQLALGAEPFRIDGIEHLLRVREELVVVRYRLRLAADG